MPDGKTRSEPSATSAEQGFTIGPDLLAFLLAYRDIFLRMLAVAVPVTWGVAMLTSMSFLRANTIEGMVTGLTASIVVALVACGIVVPVALGHWWIIRARSSSWQDVQQRGRFVAAMANLLLLLLWAAVMILQHRLGANLFFWHLFGIDEPSPLFNPDIDANWARAFFVLIGSTAIVGIGRYLRPSYVVFWFFLTALTAIGWVILTLLFTLSKDLIDHRIAIAAHEGTLPWWEPRSEGSTFLLVLVLLVGFFRVRSAWLAVRGTGSGVDR